MSRYATRAIPAITLGIAVAALAACGGSGSKKSSGSSGQASSVKGLAAVKATVAAAERPAQWQAPGPALHAASARGKRILLLNEGVNQFNDEFTSGVKAAAGSVGMSVSVANALDVPTQSQDILNAINGHVAAIVLNSEDPKSLTSALSRAKKAGVVVVSAFNGDPGLPTGEQKQAGVFGNVSYCYSCAGRLVADYEIARTGGHVNASIQQMAGLPSSDDTVNGFKQELAKHCPTTCKAKTSDIPINGSRNQPIQSSAQVAAANQSVNVLFPVYDFMIEYELPQVQSGGASKRIDIDSQNADLGPMQQLAAQTAVRANVGNPVPWDGWGAVDQVLRGLLHQQPAADEHTPLRLFDRSNVKSVNLKADPATWYGGSNYQSKYRQLWGS